MTTNKALELIATARYPHSMANLQQLILDAEACATNYGKRSFFGKDKFQAKLQQFELTLGRCLMSLAADGAVTDPQDLVVAMAELNDVMQHLEDTYSSWPLAFQFWKVYCSRVAVK